jgi:DNA-binding phage protein
VKHKGYPAAIYDDDDVVRLLRAEVERVGGQTAFARKCGLSRANLNKILHGSLSPTKSVIKALKLRKVYVSE